MTANEVARWFLLRNDVEVEFGDADFITHLKLQKLLYYAQGISLAVYDKPIFEEEILAWKHGPVVQSVYDKYKNCGSFPIEIQREDGDNEIYQSLKKEDFYSNVLEATFSNYGRYSAWHLRDMTHEERPWKETPHNCAINRSLIKEFFREEVIDYEA